MASFYGSSFIYDNVPSELYDLRIFDFDTGESESSGGGEVEIHEKYIYRDSLPQFYGRTQNTPLEFELTIGSYNPIPGERRSIIEKWLLGRNNYLPFQIVQDDVSDVIFDVIFTKITAKYIGNLQVAFVLHGRCFGPWGRTYPRTLAYEFTGDNVVNFDFSFLNDSANSDYYYPIVTFSLNSVGTGFSLINHTDNERTFSFTGLLANETVTVDNRRRLIESDSSIAARINNFNMKWFRLVPGPNYMTIQSGIGTFSMTYTFARKVDI